MPPPEYGQSLGGLSLNLLSTDLSRATQFHTDVLEVHVKYVDSDLLVAEGFGTSWMVHADHTYDQHPLLGLVGTAPTRGVGMEIRVHGCDPDFVAERAVAHGFEVFDGPRDQPDHGLREVHIQDHDGYMWVADVPLLGEE